MGRVEETMRQGETARPGRVWLRVAASIVAAGGAIGLACVLRLGCGDGEGVWPPGSITMRRPDPATVPREVNVADLVTLPGDADLRRSAGRGDLRVAWRDRQAGDPLVVYITRGVSVMERIEFKVRSIRASRMVVAKYQEGPPLGADPVVLDRVDLESLSAR